jgi:hypothetical protein
VADVITIQRPEVPHGPEGMPPRLATALYLGEVVKKIERFVVDQDGYRQRRVHIGGSNVTATVVDMLNDIISVLRRDPTVGDGQLDVDEIDERARAATQGPWTIKRADHSIVRDSGGLGVVQDLWVADVDVDHEDAVFIAHSRDDVPVLVGEVRRLRGLIAAALAEMDESTYGDPEAVFRMRARLDPDREHGPFGATDRDGVPL